MFRMWIGLVVAAALAASAALAQEKDGGRAPAKRGIATPPAATTTTEEPKPAADSELPLGMAPMGTRGAFGTGGGRTVAAGVAPGAQSKAETTSRPEALTVLKSGTPEHTRLVCQLKNAPAAQTANTVAQVFRSEGELRHSDAKSTEQIVGRNVVVVPSTIDNSLVISGSPDAVNEVRKLVEELDRRPGSVLVDMEIGEAPASEVKPSEPAAGEQLRLAEKPPHMETIGRIQVTTLNNQMAFAQLGARVPVIANTTVTSKGTANSINLLDVGLILRVTPRVSADGTIVMQINVVRSSLRPESEGTPLLTQDDKVVARTPRIENTEVFATVKIADGQSAILGGVAGEGKSDKELVIIVTPHIIGMEEAKKAP
jgi:hypothetical protein